MADVIVSADASYGPPRNVIVAHATGGSILESCEVTRIVGGVEEPIRRQPIVGVSDVTLYDYEAPYDRSAVYRIQGMERNTLASSWTGNKDASTSQLSQDGVVVATNLLTSPRTLDGYAVKWGNPNNVSLQTDDNGDTYLHIVGGNTTYVVAFPGVDRPAISTACVQARSNVNIDAVNVNYNHFQHLTGDGMWHYMQATDSTTPVWTPTGTIFGCESSLKDGQYLDFKMPALFSPSDFQGMQARGVTWFDGDSFQAGTTTQYDESSSPVTLSPDTGWLIHPGNPAKSMRLPLGHITGMGDTTRRSNATRHDILGARYPIYTNPGPRYSRELSMKLRTRTADDENMLDNLLDDQTPILFNPRGVDASRLNLNPMYLQVGDVTAARYAQSLYPTSDSPQHWRDWALPCTQVDSPAVSQQAVGWTYAQLLNDNTRYQSVIISYKDYASLQAHSVKDGQ